MSSSVYYSIKAIIIAILTFTAIMFAFSLLQGIVTAIIHYGDKNHWTVYDFGTYSLFAWVAQIFYIICSICISILGAKAAYENYD